MAAEPQSITIDTRQLISAAVASIFEQHNPEGLARAMAETSLKAADRWQSTTTVLDAIIGTVVSNMATEIVTAILEEHRDEFINLIVQLCEDDVVAYCAKLVSERIKKAVV